jgi:hypothetical protein
MQRIKNNELCYSERHLTAMYNNQFITAIKEDNVLMAFITRKEQTDIELAIKLQKNSVITTLRDLFKRS